MATAQGTVEDGARAALTPQRVSNPEAVKADRAVDNAWAARHLWLSGWSRLEVGAEAAEQGEADVVQDLTDRCRVGPDHGVHGADHGQPRGLGGEVSGSLDREVQDRPHEPHEQTEEQLADQHDQKPQETAWDHR